MNKLLGLVSSWNFPYEYKPNLKRTRILSIPEGRIEIVWKRFQLEEKRPKGDLPDVVCVDFVKE